MLHQSQLSPALALLQLVVLPDSATPSAAQSLLRHAASQGDETFQETLNLVEAIRISKFPYLSQEEMLAMLDIKTADITQTRFYQDVFQEGREEGREKGREKGRREGEAMLLVRLLNRLVGPLSDLQEERIRALPLEQLDALGDALFEFASEAALMAWLQREQTQV